jgi:hypothetical protein
MKRLGKPDTGNPFVQFDEGRRGSAELTTAVSSTRLLPLRRLNPARGPEREFHARRVKNSRKMPPPKNPPPVLFGILRERPVGIGIAKKNSTGVDSACDLDNFDDRHPTNENQKLLTL